jgi:Flp pilus assembly pilin Flp
MTREPIAMSTSTLVRFFGDDDGAVAIEYALIAVIVSVSIAAALRLIVIELQASFNSVNSGFQ